MRISCLIENTSRKGMAVEHGLSLYIETDYFQHILFDMGQSKLFAENAIQMNIDLDKVELAILSHGHYDHGGGLKTFLDINRHAKVYIHQQAFEPHYSMRINQLHAIGLDKSLQYHPQIHACKGNTICSPHLRLISEINGNILFPPGNKMLYGPIKDTHDTFCHEQSLLIHENSKLVLFAGCAHKGIVNILMQAEAITGRPVTHVFSGMHLAKNGLPATEEEQFITDLANLLIQHSNCQFYTMHCTGTDAYNKLKKLMGNRINYLSCGDTVYI